MKSLFNEKTVNRAHLVHVVMLSLTLVLLCLVCYYVKLSVFLSVPLHAVVEDITMLMYKH